MSEPRRPDPQPRWPERVRARFDAQRRRWPNRKHKLGFASDADAISLDPDDSPSLLVTAGVALVAAALAIGGLWMWQSWSQRSAEPIDDRLPMLVQSGSEPPMSDAGGVPPESEMVEDTPGSVTNPNPEVSVTNAPVSVDVPVDVVVHVSGAVLRPGVVDLPTGSRVFEAVTLAGGPAAHADLDRINLAAPIVDGERIHVPAIGEEQAPTLVPPERPLVPSAPEPPSETEAPIVPVDINEASAFELDMLPGVGPATAEAIVALRTERGPFLSVDELLDVPGIGEAKLALLRAHVVVTVGG